MQVELYCAKCSNRFVAPPETSAAQILSRMVDEGRWYPLGDGETFEDMIFSALTEQGAIFCPRCGETAAVSEESLGLVALDLLAEW
jgi:hypothetical protein